MNSVPQLPDGWCSPTVSEVGNVVSGQTPKGISSISEPGNIPWFRVSDMNEPGNEEYLSKALVQLSLEEAKSFKLHIRPEGTLVFPKRGGAIATNKKRLLGQDSAYDLNLMGIIPINIDIRFLWHWFQTVDLKSLSDGSNVPQINHGDIEPLQIPLPPLNEQHRIVTKIEALTARSRKARAALDAIPALLDQFRQSVLAAAFRGDLTADWRAQNPDVDLAEKLLACLTNAHDLHGGHKKGNAAAPTEGVHVLTEDIFPNTWKIAELRDICVPQRPITYGILKPGPELIEGVPYIRVADFPNDTLNLVQCQS